MRDFFYIAIIIALGALLLRGRSTQAEPLEERVEVDTVYITTTPPILQHKLIEVAKVNIPRLIFAKDKTIEDPDLLMDSVEVEVEIVERIYQDSTFEAKVSGPTIAGYGPKLDYIRSFNKTVTRTEFRIPDKWTEVNVSTGAYYVKNNADIWAGISVTRRHERFFYGGSAGYALSGSPYIEVRGGFVLWKKYR